MGRTCSGFGEYQVNDFHPMLSGTSYQTWVSCSRREWWVVLLMPQQEHACLLSTRHNVA